MECSLLGKGPGLKISTSNLYKTSSMIDSKSVQQSWVGLRRLAKIRREFFSLSIRFRDGTSRSHSLNTPRLVGLLWTSDQPDAETSYWQNKTLTINIQAPERFVLTMPVSFHPPGIKPWFLDRLACGLGMKSRGCIGVSSPSVLLAEYCLDSETKNNEIGWACST